MRGRIPDRADRAEFQRLARIPAPDRTYEQRESWAQIYDRGHEPAINEPAFRCNPIIYQDGRYSTDGAAFLRLRFLLGRGNDPLSCPEIVDLLKKLFGSQKTY